VRQPSHDCRRGYRLHRFGNDIRVENCDHPILT
jgi:hypothetical protein